MNRAHRSLPLPLLLLALLIPAACASEHVEADQPKSAATRAFREQHIECNPHFYRTPCQIGPDGRLYQYLPGEPDPTKKQ
jgi:hypothetical protein